MTYYAMLSYATHADGNLDEIVCWYEYSEADFTFRRLTLQSATSERMPSEKASDRRQKPGGDTGKVASLLARAGRSQPGGAAGPSPSPARRARNNKQ